MQRIIGQFKNLLKVEVHIKEVQPLQGVKVLIREVLGQVEVVEVCQEVHRVIRGHLDQVHPDRQVVAGQDHLDRQVRRVVQEGKI